MRPSLFRRGPRPVRAPLPLALGVLFGAALGCGGTERREPASLRLLEFPQAGSRGVRLNESLQFQFSAELDRSSITAASFVIEDASGKRARGEVRQRSSTLLFVPDLPLRGDLIDAGLLPGRTYTVRLLGFPAPDGIRGIGGEPLEASAVFQFKTAGEADGEAVFLPPISAGLPLVFRCPKQSLAPLEEILLETSEAVDPRSVHDDAFELIPEWGDGGPERIPLHARVVENRPDRAVVALRPLLDPRRPNSHSVLEPGRYWLAERPNVQRFGTLGGLEITPLWSASGEPGLRLGVGEGEVHSEREEFDGLGGGSPIRVVGVDGTAFFDGGGEVRLRFPAAAGSGRDGPVENLKLELVERFGERLEGADLDLHGTRVVLPDAGEGGDLDLSGLRGPVVIRAQRSLELAGVLRRGGEAAPESIRDWIERRQSALKRAVGALGDFLEQVPDGERSPSQEAHLRELREDLSEAEEALKLSTFVTDAVNAGLPWTILIAGGDVRIPGELHIEGELLIAAGGWLRVRGMVSAGSVWTTPEGGGGFGVLRDAPNRLPLRLDPPTTNPLRESLRVALASRSIRPQGGVEEWLGLTVFAHEGRGRVRVRAIGERASNTGPAEDFGPVDDLGLLRGCDAVRLVIELTQDPPEGGSGGAPDPASAVWDPPRVDAVEVTWKPARRSGGGLGYPREPRTH